jgi:hypothetical protein
MVIKTVSEFVNSNEGDSSPFSQVQNSALRTGERTKVLSGQNVVISGQITFGVGKLDIEKDSEYVHPFVDSTNIW